MSDKPNPALLVIAFMPDKTNGFIRFSSLFDNYTSLIFIRLKVH